MLYRSTRDVQAKCVSFEQALFLGLAPDAGLYIPLSIPALTQAQLQSWSDLSFNELACNILRLYIDPLELSNEDLAIIVEKSYSTFSHPEIAPTSRLNEDKNLLLLQLFHGPTYAFKDVALQFVGNLFEHYLKNTDKHINVLGATSGDTGGAAIYGLRGKDKVNIFILFPKDRISNVQVPDPNVHNVSIQGTFDDCQEVVKTLFANAEFREKHQLAAVNSINWARILVQTIYYFYSFFQAQAKYPGKKIQYSVPTGNFGDVLAGYFAKRMGLPIHKLIVATNENNILTRFFCSGTYQKPDTCIATLSPAMDILASSNFERLLWYLERGDACKVSDSDADRHASEMVMQHMGNLKKQFGFTVAENIHTRSLEIFASYSVSDTQTKDCIKRYYNNTRFESKDTAPLILDPHTAVGIVAAEMIGATDDSLLTICLSTAHPGKFPDAVLSAINGDSGKADLKWEDFAPQPLVAAMHMKKRCIHLDTDGGIVAVAVQKVMTLIEKTLME